MMKLAFTFIIFIVYAPILEAAYCSEIDLRDHSTPPRSQLFTFDNKVQDSRYCYAFALATAAGKELGKAVSVEHLVIQYMKTWKGLTSEYMFPVYGSGGGMLEEAHEAVKKIGYCPASEFKVYLQSIAKGSDWYTSLRSRAKLLKTPQKLFDEVDTACKSSTNNLSNSIVVPAESNVEKINDLLNAGKPVIFSYDFHVVTILGRTRSCDYIIQDSLPNSHRALLAKSDKTGEFKNPYYLTQGEHIQFWKMEALSHVLESGNSGLEYIQQSSDHNSRQTHQQTSTIAIQ